MFARSSFASTHQKRMDISLSLNLRGTHSCPTLLLRGKRRRDDDESPTTTTTARRIVATAAVTCFLLCLAASVAILLREFQSDADAVQRKPMYQHPHAHDGSLLDRLEDVEETVYKRLDPYLRDETGVIGSLRKPIDLPRFHHRWQKRDQRP